jgi:alpha-beta hydrolase superfamily lysophospholipase
LAPETAAATRGTLKSADGTTLAYRAWPIQGATITFAVVHGLGEHSGRYERFARGMARHGMATYALDLRGHGESEGQRGHVDSWSEWVDDAAVFVSRVENEAQGEVIPLGHSFGGAIMLTTVRTGRLSHAKRFVLSSPALKLKAHVPVWKDFLAGAASQFVPRLALDNEVDPASVSRIPEVVDAYRTDPLVHSRISSRTYAEWMKAAAANLEFAADITIPFLIIAGTADRLIDPKGSEELHQKTPDHSELHVLEGRYHEPFNDRDSDEVFDLIADWVQKK